jgi:hypothetical protein
MHPEAYAYVADQCRLFVQPSMSVVEIGGRNINGTIRPLFTTEQYTAVDIAEGPGVDVIADGAEWQPAEPVHCVVCSEVLEHTPRVKDIINNAARMLRPQGRLIVTCAGPRRSPHSAVDGRELQPGEFYENISPDRVLQILAEPDPEVGGRRWTAFEVSITRAGEDCYFFATRA